VSGALHFRLGEALEREVTVRAGEVLHIPAHLPHEATALEDTLDVDIFSPPRADWLDGSDAYFHAAAHDDAARGGAAPSVEAPATSHPQADGAEEAPE
jgi:ribosomal protein L16 Arg81 hydroxylase